MSQQEPPSDADTLSDWLEGDDAASRPHRIERLRFITELHSFSDRGLLLHGGHPAALLFEEARCSYLQGLFYSVPILAMSLLELQVAGRLYAAGEDEARTRPMSKLITEAAARGLLDSGEVTDLTRLGAMRNSLVHFRAPLEPGTLLRRAISAEQSLDEVLAGDARWALRVMYKFVLRQAV